MIADGKSYSKNVRKIKNRTMNHGLIFRPGIENIGVMALIGATACGKSVQGRCLETALTSSLGGPSTVVYVEMSDIIGSAAEKDCRIGEDVRAAASHMEGGGYLPDSLTEAVFNSWVLKNLRDPKSITTLIIGGLPRTRRQHPFLRHFGPSLIIHLQTERDQAEQYVRQRAKLAPPGKIRKDDVGTFELKWRLYESETLPPLLERDDVLHLKRSRSLADRTACIIEHCRNLGIRSPISGRAVSRTLHRLRQNPHHPVHAFIADIESGRVAA